MKNSWTKNNFLLRLAQKEDAESYYNRNFNPLDPEVARLTGCKSSFTHDEVVNFLNQCIDSDDRYDFFIIAPDGSIVGESVISDIHSGLKSASFRIAIFHSNHREQGLGSWAIQCMLEFAFEELKLHRLELEVFSFNPRAKKAYEKAGFRQEGILRDSILDGENYADTILMAMLEDEYHS